MAKGFGFTAKQTSTSFDKPPVGDERTSKRKITGLKGLMRKMAQSMSASSAVRACRGNDGCAVAPQQGVSEAVAAPADAFFITRARNTGGSEEHSPALNGGSVEQASAPAMATEQENTALDGAGNKAGNGTPNSASNGAQPMVETAAPKASAGAFGMAAAAFGFKELKNGQAPQNAPMGSAKTPATSASNPADGAKGPAAPEAPVVNPPLRTRPWQRVLSVTMSLLLAATMFDATGLSPLFADASAAEAESSQPSDGAADGDQPTEGDQSAEGADNGEDSDESANPAESGNDDQSPAGDGNGSEATEPSGEGNGETATQPEDEPAPIDEAAEAAKLLPEHLVSATDVLPSKFEGDDDISSRINPTVTLFGAPMVAGTGFLVKNGPAQAEYTLGNLAALLEDGRLGGSAVGDAVVLTFELPYLYEDADGQLATTYSEELWKVKRGITADNNAAGAAPMRAALFADAVPQGWSAWQEHDGAYLKLTDADLKAGVSGKIVFRYEGEVPAGLTTQEAEDYNGPTAATAPNRTPAAITAESSMPTVGFGLVGAVPADEEVAVRFGYEARSFTPAPTAEDENPATQYGRAMVKTLGSVNLLNDETNAAATVSVENVEGAVINSEGGYLVSKVQVAVPDNKPAVSGVSISGLWPTDANGFGGVPAAVLMAYKEGEDGTPVPNLGDNGAPDTSKDARERGTFVGVPGEGGVVVVDVTDLTDSQRAALDFNSRDSLREAGVSAIPYKVTEEGLLTLTLDGDEGAVKAGEQRTFFVAAPYALGAMELEDAPEALPGADSASPLGVAPTGSSVQKFKPVKSELDVSVLVRTEGKAVALPFHQRLSATFTRTADPEAPAASEGDGQGGSDDGDSSDGEGDDPDADNAPANEPEEEESTYTPPHQRAAGGAHEHLRPWPHCVGQRHEPLFGAAL